MIFETKVVHCKSREFDITRDTDVYIGRPSKWGNPFSHRGGTKALFVVPTVEEAINLYDLWLNEQEALLAVLEQLRGKTLGCWCKPRLCHGDVLAARAEGCKCDVETVLYNARRSDNHIGHGSICPLRVTPVEVIGSA